MSVENRYYCVHVELRKTRYPLIIASNNLRDAILLSLPFAKTVCLLNRSFELLEKVFKSVAVRIFTFKTAAECKGLMIVIKRE